MSIPAIATTIHASIPLLDGSNWPKWSRMMKNFFSAAKATHIISGSPLKEDDAKFSDWQSVDEQLSAFILAKMDPELWYLVDDVDVPSGRYAWQALKAHYEKSTIGHRVEARKHLYHGITHDPSKPIGMFIHEVVSAAQKLKDMDCKVEDSEITDIILMGLDSSLHHVRTTILVLEKQPTLDELKKLLTSATSVAPPSSSLHSAFAVSGKAKLPRSSGHGSFPSNPNTSPSPNSAGVFSGPPLDSKGFRWCNPTNEGHCHRCGREGHIAARCMYNMPQDVKNWIVATSYQNRHPDIEKANTVHHFLSSPPGSSPGSPAPSPPSSPRLSYAYTAYSRPMLI